MTVKVSAPMNKALIALRNFAAAELKDPQPINAIKIDDEQFVSLINDYSTTLASGTERGITVEDVEAVGNFHRDIHSGVRLITAEAGVEYLENNQDADSFKMSFELPQVAGHGLSTTAAFYRPGKEEETSQDYSAITRTWTASADDKLIDDHLAALSVRLKSGKKK